MATNLQQTDSTTEEVDKSEEDDKYVHLIGSAEIKFEDNIFKLYFLNDKGAPIEGVNPLKFLPTTKSVKFLNIHLIAELWGQPFKDQMANFEKALPYLKALIQPVTKPVPPIPNKGNLQPSTAATNGGESPTNEDEKLPFHPFMNPTDPPKN